MRTKSGDQERFVLPSTQEFRQVDEPWFQLLLKSQKYKVKRAYMVEIMSYSPCLWHTFRQDTK